MAADQGGSAAAGVLTRLTSGIRATAGAAVRRARRERQWRRHGAALRLSVEGPDRFPHPIATHASPTRRVLAGVDPDLQVAKETNLALACAQLDGRVLRPGQRFSFWYLVGRPTAARGYLPGVVLSHGRVTSGAAAASASSRTFSTG